RLYAACVDRASRTGTPRAFDATVGRLGAVLHASSATGRRRLAELEAAGLVEVTERPGGWLSVRAVLDMDEAVDVARTSATEGRRRAAPRRASDPPGRLRRLARRPRGRRVKSGPRARGRSWLVTGAARP